MVLPLHLWQNRIIVQKIWKSVGLEVLFGKWQATKVSGIDPIFRIKTKIEIYKSLDFFFDDVDSQMAW